MTSKPNQHMLLVGRSREIHEKVSSKAIRATLMIGISKLHERKLAPHYHRVVALPASAKASDWVDFAKFIHSVDPFTCIGAFSENYEFQAADIARALGLPFNPIQVIELTHKKDLMRAFLSENGLDDTKFCRFSPPFDRAAILRVVEDMGFPVIAKPVDARGSLAVRAVSCEAELDRALSVFAQAANDHDLLIEKLLAGPEYSVEAFSERGRHKIVCITEKYKDSATCVEMGHLIPARLSEKPERLIKDFVLRFLLAIGVQDGPTHTEVFLTENGPRLVESHARVGGDRIPDLVKYVSNVDLCELWIDQVMGRCVLNQVPELGSSGSNGMWASVQFAALRSRGTIKSITNETEAKQQNHVKDAGALLSVGDFVSGELVDSFSRAAEAVALSESAETAIQAARTACETVAFEVATKSDEGSGQA